MITKACSLNGLQIIEYPICAGLIHQEVCGFSESRFPGAAFQAKMAASRGIFCHSCAPQMATSPQWIVGPAEESRIGCCHNMVVWGYEDRAA